jgi:hypothetical protein
LAKWLGGGAFAAVVTTGAIATIKTQAPFRHAGAISAPVNEASPAHTSLARSLTPPPTVRPDSAPELPFLPEPGLPATEPNAFDSPGKAVRAVRRRLQSSTQLADEVTILDRAREALADGAAGRALHTLDEHDRRFPSGALSIEAHVLRIDALAGSGDIATASRLAEEFLAQNPTSAHAARLRSFLSSLRNTHRP